MEVFKGDTTEQKMIASALPAFESVSGFKDDFLADCYDCAPFGKLLYDSKRVPLASAVAYANFKLFFNSLFSAFSLTGTFEVYISVFKMVFGDSVDVQFAVPAAGKLNIVINASSVESYPFVAEDGSTIVTQAGEQLIFQQVIGFQTEYQVTQMLFEMVPAGVYTTVTLNVV